MLRHETFKFINTILITAVGQRQLRLQELCAEIQAAGGEAQVIDADLSEASERQAVALQVLDTWSAPDILVKG